VDGEVLVAEGPLEVGHVVRQRDDAQDRQSQILLQVFGAAVAVVEEFSPEGSRSPHHQTDEQGGRQVARQARLVWSARNPGPIDNGQVAGQRPAVHAAGNPDLLVALQQPFVEGPVGVHLPLQDRVLDVPVLIVHHLRFQSCQLLAQQLLFLH
jgi:hypothetical protein